MRDDELMLIFGGPKPPSGSEYWRGKYEALKEVYDMRLGPDDWGKFFEDKDKKTAK